MQDVPGGPGRFARREDLGNVKKIQREGKNIAEASGGPYGQRKDLQEISSGAPTSAPTPAGMGQPTGLSQIPSVNAFAPGSGNQGVPLSQGAIGGPGAGPEILQAPVDDTNVGATLARAMYLANPTPQLQMLVEAFNQEGISG